eukprot:8764871-Ditylum_brightwellii.AAC.1
MCCIKATTFNDTVDHFLGPLFITNASLIEKHLIHCKEESHFKSSLLQYLMKQVIQVHACTKCAFLKAIAQGHSNDWQYNRKHLQVCFGANVQPPLTKVKL